MTRGHVTYTDEAKAVALAALRASRWNYSETERLTGIDRRSLRRWATETPEAVEQIAQQKSADLSSLMADIAYRGARLERRAFDHFETLTDAEIAEHLPEINRVTGTAIDKTQLLGGEPTERVAHVVDLDLSHGD